MDREYIIENQVIERYLQDHLSDDEQAAFEAAYVSSPELLDDLEAASRLQQGLRDLAILEGAKPSPRQRSRWPAVFRMPQYAMAASVALLVSVALIGTLLQQQNRPADPFNTHIQPLVETRSTPGNGAVNVIQRSDRRSHFVLMVDPGFTPYADYRTTVLRQVGGGDGSPVWQAEGLTPGYEDMLALGLPASLLAPGDYEVLVEGRRDTAQAGQDYDEISRVSFTVVDSP